MATPETQGEHQNQNATTANGTTRSRFHIEGRRIPANELINQIADLPRFGAIRDRFYNIMLARICVPYYTTFPLLARRFFEFLALVNAIMLLSVLVYIHFLVAKYPANCFDQIKENWPKKGIVRIEVIQNLEEFQEIQWRKQNEDQNCHFNLTEILRTGKLPDELHRLEIAEEQHNKNAQQNLMLHQNKPEKALSIWVNASRWLLNELGKMNFYGIGEEENENDNESRFGDNELDKDFPFMEGVDHPSYNNLFEFSLHYGLLRLNSDMRQQLNVNTLVLQFDVERDICFREWREQPLMRYLIGIDELMMASVKRLSENQTERGYLRDLIHGEVYHFITVGKPLAQYFTAFVVMMIFTFAISMLLRFSHDLVFVFIIDLFQMFEQNLPLFFPIAPLLTVILALVGMEAIMSEVFNDTSTAFYVILLIWVADQYDALFSHSSIGRRFWLKFFYLYHFAFYAYQYRYNGLYGGLALLTSAAFILHSMIFFFHHYELPYMIFLERLESAVQNLQNAENVNGNVDLMRIRRVINNSNIHENENENNAQQTTEDSIQIGNLLLRDRSLVAALSTIFENQVSSTVITDFETRSEVNEQQHPSDEASNLSNISESSGNEQINLTRLAAERIADSILEDTMRELEGTIRNLQDS